MTRADTLKQISDYLDGMSTLFEQWAADEATAPVSAAGPVAADSLPAVPASIPPSFDELPPEEWDVGSVAKVLPQAAADEGFDAVCPKHRVPYTEGQYGPYCKQGTDDPAWGKQKGDRLWCKITPKNAAQYLRVRAAA